MPEQRDLQQFSELVGAIYDCAIDPDLWPETLERLRRELRYANCALNYISHPTGKLLLNITTGIEPHWLKTMDSLAGDVIEMWGGRAAILSAAFEVPHVLSQMNPAATAATSRYIREWRAPQGLIDSVCVMLGHDTHGQGALAMGRHGDHGPITTDDIARLTPYIPHLQRAIRISRLLDDAVEQSADFHTVIDSMAAPVLFLADDLQVTHTNPAARLALERGEPFSLNRGRLWSADMVLLRRIVAALRHARAGEAGLQNDPFGIPVELGGGTVSAVHLLPLNGGARRPGSAPGAIAALFLSPLPATGRALAPLLEALYDLTPAEVRMFEQIAAGRNVGEAAALLGVAPSTARTQLLRVFDKTGVHRQAEVVKLAASLTAPVRGPDRATIEARG